MGGEELRDLLDRNEAVCSMLVGIAKAMDYGMRALIATHPDPKHLNHTWHDMLAAISDCHLDTSAPNPDMFHKGMQTSLATLTQQIELAARS